MQINVLKTPISSILRPKPISTVRVKSLNVTVIECSRWYRTSRLCTPNTVVFASFRIIIIIVYIGREVVQWCVCTRLERAATWVVNVRFRSRRFGTHRLFL